MSKFHKYKKKQHPFFKRQEDDTNFEQFFNFIMIKNIDATHKLVLNLICNDIWMNGQLQWKQETYADRLGMSRRQMVRLFKQYEELGILIPGPDNKRGGKKNVYSIELNNLSRLEKTKKPVTSKEPVTPVVVEEKEVHVTPVTSTCDMGGKTHVTPVVETCDTDVTYTTTTTILQQNTTSNLSFSSSGKDEDEDDIDTFLDGLDWSNDTYNGKKQNDTSTIQQQEVTENEMEEFLNELDI